MLKIDFHTHSVASPDGGITAKQYRQLLDDGTLDYIAVTDHNRIDFAQELHQELGNKIIIGEEIMTAEGELIGLFLDYLVEPDMTAYDTVQAIHAQGGLVYVPHPFETVRQGIQLEALDGVAKYVDIVEGHNGRAVFQNKSPRALAWAKTHQKPVAAASDAHGARGVGYTYTIVEKAPTHDTIVTSLTRARRIHNRPPLSTLAYPKLNRLRNRLKGTL